MDIDISVSNFLWEVHYIASLVCVVCLCSPFLFPVFFSKPVFWYPTYAFYPEVCSTTSGLEGANMESLADSATWKNRLLWPHDQSLTSLAFLSDRYSINWFRRSRILFATALWKSYNSVSYWQGEKECPFYMRNGSCKFGSDCKFNHPDPTAIGGVDSPLFRGNNGGSAGSFSPKAPPSQASSTSWSSSRHMNGTGTAPFIPAMFPQTRGVSQASEWNGYQVVNIIFASALLISMHVFYLCW